jgi:precorrin-2 methylase
MNAAAAASGFPLALEDTRLIVSPAESGLEHLKSWLSQGCTVVLFKAGQYIQKIRNMLPGVDIPCDLTLVERVSTSEEVIYRSLQDFPDDAAPYFSILLIRPTISVEQSPA